METFIVLIRDLVIIAFIASFCDLLLPKNQAKGPVQLVFGLYFMALMLNPIVALIHDTDLSAMDFGSLGEEALIEAETGYHEAMVYEEAAATLAKEIEGKLEAIYKGTDLTVFIEMDEKGFQMVEIGGIRSTVAAAEIKELLAAEYGIDGDCVEIIS